MAEINGVVDRKGVLLTLGVTFVAVILLAFASIMLRNAESTEERIWEIVAANKLATTDYALQNDLSKIYNSSGVSIWLNGTDTRMNITKIFSQVDLDYKKFLNSFDTLDFFVLSAYPAADISPTYFFGPNSTVNMTVLPFQNFSFFYQPPGTSITTNPAQMKIYHDAAILSYSITLRQKSSAPGGAQFSVNGFDPAGPNTIPFTVNWVWANGTNKSQVGLFNMLEDYDPGNAGYVPEINVTCSPTLCSIPTSVYGSLRIYTGRNLNDIAGRPSIFIVSNATDAIEVSVDMVFNDTSIGNKTVEVFAPRAITLNYTGTGVSKSSSATRIL